MAVETKDILSDMFQQACDSFNKTMKTGAKFQQDVARFWTDAAGKNVEEMRDQFENVAQEAFPFNKKNLERFQRLFDEQTQQTLEMLRQTFDSGRPTDIQEMFQRTSELWRTSFDTIRASADAMAKTSTEMFEGCSEFARTGWTPTNGKQTAKATK